MPDALDDYTTVYNLERTESRMVFFVLLTSILGLQGGYKYSNYDKWTDGSLRRIDTQIEVKYILQARIFFTDSTSQ